MLGKGLLPGVTESEGEDFEDEVPLAAIEQVRMGLDGRREEATSSCLEVSLYTCLPGTSDDRRIQDARPAQCPRCR